MRVCLCVCVCAHSHHACVHAHECVVSIRVSLCACACMRVCVCDRIPNAEYRIYTDVGLNSAVVVIQFEKEDKPASYYAMCPYK